MKRRISRTGIVLTAMGLLAAFAFIMVLVVPAVQARNLPEPDGTRVMDLAGVLDPAAEEALTAQMDDLAGSDQLNMAVVTVDSLKGEPAAQYAQRRAGAAGAGGGRKLCGFRRPNGRLAW